MIKQIRKIITWIYRKLCSSGEARANKAKANLNDHGAYVAEIKNSLVIVQIFNDKNDNEG